MRPEKESVVIRAAQLHDCERIAEIMGDRPDIAYTDVCTIASRLQRNGFGEHPVFYCIVAEDIVADPSRIVGYAVISRIYSTWEGKSLRLGDLYVVPDHRRKGVGTILFKRVVQDCQEQGCSRIDCSPQAANEELISFLEKHGAKDILSEEGWSFYQLSRGNMQMLAGRT